MYLAVEWTSAAFHACRIGDDGSVVGEKSTPAGVNTVSDGGFEGVLRHELGGWLEDADAVLLSGMVTGRGGWVETPYAPTPAGPVEIAGRSVRRRIQGLPPLAFLPGVAQTDPLPDVMRGEEIAILGCGQSDAVVVVAGAHSKWVVLERGRIAGITTYLTGELHRLLLADLIVSRLVPSEIEDDLESFDRGVDASVRPARALFSARTLALFDRLPAAHIPSYLDGVLIGSELREALSADAPGALRVYVLGTAAQSARYQRAARRLGRTIEPIARNAPAGFNRIAAALATSG